MATPFLVNTHDILLSVFAPSTYLTLLRRRHYAYVLNTAPFICSLLGLLRGRPTSLSTLHFFLYNNAAVPGGITHRYRRHNVGLLDICNSARDSPRTIIGLSSPLSHFVRASNCTTTNMRVGIISSTHGALPPNYRNRRTSHNPGIFVKCFSRPRLATHTLSRRN